MNALNSDILLTYCFLYASMYIQMLSECVCFFLTCLQILLFYIKAEQKPPKHFSKYFSRKALNICKLYFFSASLVSSSAFRFIFLTIKLNRFRILTVLKIYWHFSRKAFIICQLNNFSGLYL